MTATWPWKTTENGSLFSTVLSTSLPSQALFPLQCAPPSTPTDTHTHTHTPNHTCMYTHSSFSHGTDRCTMCIIEIDPVIQLHNQKQPSPRCSCTLTEGIAKAGERHQNGTHAESYCKPPKKWEFNLDLPRRVSVHVLGKRMNWIKLGICALCGRSKVAQKSKKLWKTDQITSVCSQNENKTTIILTTEPFSPICSILERSQSAQSDGRENGGWIIRPGMIRTESARSERALYQRKQRTASSLKDTTGAHHAQIKGQRSIFPSISSHLA